MKLNLKMQIKKYILQLFNLIFIMIIILLAVIISYLRYWGTSLLFYFYGPVVPIGRTSDLHSEGLRVRVASGPPTQKLK